MVKSLNSFEEYGLLADGGVIVEHLNGNELSDNILGFSRTKHKGMEL